MVPKNIETLEEPRAAADELAKYLRHGELILLLGAGVSKGLGLPSWEELVESCADAAGIDRSTRPRFAASSLLERMDIVRRAKPKPDEFEDLVRGALYGHLPGGEDGDFGVRDLQKPMMISLGALLMSSTRGSVLEAINFNVDDVLESYLDIHGFRTQSVTEEHPMLRGDVDVVVIHPHGFLPRDTSRRGKPSALVLTSQQYEERLSEDGSAPWTSLLVSRFRTKMLLAIGLSMTDLDLLQLLKKCEGARYPLGFVVNHFDDDDDGNDERERLRERSLVPVGVEDHAEIPELLLEICRQASRQSES